MGGLCYGDTFNDAVNISKTVNTFNK